MVTKASKTQKLGSFTCKYKNLHGFGTKQPINAIKMVKINGKLQLLN